MVAEIERCLTDVTTRRHYAPESSDVSADLADLEALLEYVETLGTRGPDWEGRG